MKLIKYLFIVFIISINVTSVYADGITEKAEAAVADILFENELDEYTTYSIEEDGSVDITFPNNTPNKIYGKIVRELKSHKNIVSVLPGRGGPACSLF